MDKDKYLAEMEALSKLRSENQNPTPKKKETNAGMNEGLMYFPLDVPSNLVDLKIDASLNNISSQKLLSDYTESIKENIKVRSGIAPLSEMKRNTSEKIFKSPTIDNSGNSISYDVGDYSIKFIDYLKDNIKSKSDSVEDLARRYVNSTFEEGGIEGLPPSAYNPEIKSTIKYPTFGLTKEMGIMNNFDKPKTTEEVYKEQVLGTLLRTVKPLLDKTNKALEVASGVGKKVAVTATTDKFEKNFLHQVKNSFTSWNVTEIEKSIPKWDTEKNIPDDFEDAINDGRVKVLRVVNFRVGGTNDNVVQVEVTPKKSQIGDKGFSSAMKTVALTSGYAFDEVKEHVAPEKKKRYLITLDNSVNKEEGNLALWLDNELSMSDSFIEGDKANLFKIQQDRKAKGILDELYNKVPYEVKNPTTGKIERYVEHMTEVPTKNGKITPLYFTGIEDTEEGIKRFQIKNEEGDTIYDSTTDGSFEDEIQGRDENGKLITKPGALSTIIELISNKK